jgi:hypothetical protein
MNVVHQRIGTIQLESASSPCSTHSLDIIDLQIHDTQYYPGYVSTCDAGPNIICQLGISSYPEPLSGIPAMEVEFESLPLPSPLRYAIGLILPWCWCRLNV